MSDTRLMTKREVAEYVHQTPRTVERLMRQGLPHFKVSARATRFRRGDIDTWLENRCRVVRG